MCKYIRVPTRDSKLLRQETTTTITMQQSNDDGSGEAAATLAVSDELSTLIR